MVRLGVFVVSLFVTELRPRKFRTLRVNTAALACP